MFTLEFMKTSKAWPRRWRLWLFLLWLSCACNIVWATTTTFTFTLDEPCKTSAGVFKPDGTLIRTLWSKVRFQAGTNSAVWDGLDDETNAAPEGIYEIRLLQHNTEYVWDGAIGNTSAELSGPTVHHGFWPIRDIAISGTNAFYVSGYNEGGYDFRSFVTTEPQRVKASWFWVFNEDTNKSAYSIPGTVYDLNWLWTVSDSNRVYFACSATTDPYDLRFTTNRNNRAGCIVSCDVSDNGQADFTNGIKINLQFVNTYLTTNFTTNVIGNVTNIDANTVTNPYYVRLKRGIYAGTQPGLSGLGVQQNGNLLAASVAPDNRVYLKDKITGAELNDFFVSVPKGLSFSSDGSLWVISSNLHSVICYTNLSISPAVAVTISNLVKPLAVAVNPNNPNLILVADGGSSQQVKAFDSTGNSVWTYGEAGGYQTNGVAVTPNKFWFFDGENEGTFLSFAPDGSFWVGDGANHRCLHYSAARNFLEQIMCQPHTRVACVDQNNPSRVFNEFLEFNVDYSKPLPQAWTLVNNWKANLGSNYFSYYQGLYEMTTFTNGRTYGLIDNISSGHAVKELVELGTDYLRFTGVDPMATNQARWISFGADGSARATVIQEAKWYESSLAGFDTSNNPIWNTEVLIASAPEGSRDPVPRFGGLGNIRLIINTNDILISFDQSQSNGWHLGGIKLGSTNWL